MKIGVVCFPTFGGSGVVASEIADGLAARGHRVHLFASARPWRAGESVVFHEVTAPTYPLFEHTPWMLALASKLLEVCRAERLDLLHVHYALPHAAIGYLVRQLLGELAPKLVVSLHGTDVTRVGSDPAYRAVTAATVEAADAIVVPSAFLQREANERLGLDVSRVEVIPNFVDTARFAPPEERDRRRLLSLFSDARADEALLFHVSNFRPVKRAGDLIWMLHHVNRRMGARLVLVGDGPERAHVEEAAEVLGLSPRIAFLGKRSDFLDYLPHADAFLLTSETESFGLAALEALACSVPVFAYRVGGVPEVVGEEAGGLAEPFDVESLARGVCDVLADPARRERMGEAARARVLERFREGPALDRYEALFRGICE